MVEDEASRSRDSRAKSAVPRPQETGQQHCPTYLPEIMRQQQEQREEHEERQHAAPHRLQAPVRRRRLAG